MCLIVWYNQIEHIVYCCSTLWPWFLWGKSIKQDQSFKLSSTQSYYSLSSLQQNKHLESSLIVNLKEYIPRMIDKLANGKNWISSTTCRCLVKLFFVPMRTMLLFCIFIGNTIWREMEDAVPNNIYGCTILGLDFLFWVFQQIKAEKLINILRT